MVLPSQVSGGIFDSPPLFGVEFRPHTRSLPQYLGLTSGCVRRCVIPSGSTGDLTFSVADLSISLGGPEDDIFSGLGPGLPTCNHNCLTIASMVESFIVRHDVVNGQYHM